MAKLTIEELAAAGIEIHGISLTDPKDPEGPCIMRVDIFPLTEEIGREMFPKIKETVQKFLNEKGIVSKDSIDLTGVGPTQ